MSGLSDQEVFDIRRGARIFLQEKFRREMREIVTIEIIDNYTHQDAPENASRLWHLGKSIQQMGEADVIYFCDGWHKAKGCWVERFIAFLYKLPII